MELYRESKPMEKGYAERFYQAWNSKMLDHKNTTVALTTRVSRIRRGQCLSRLNLVEPDSRGVTTLTGTVEEGVKPRDRKSLTKLRLGLDKMVGCLEALLKLPYMIVPVPGQVAMII